MTKKDLKKLYENIPLMDDKQYIEFHRVLGDKIRHLIFKEICLHPGISGKEILVNFSITQPTLSFHIAQLVKNRIIKEKRDGQSHTYYPNYHRIMSFHKTIILHHAQIEDAIGRLYETALPFIKELKK